MKKYLASMVVLYVLLISGGDSKLMAQVSSGQEDSGVSAGISSLVSGQVSAAVVQGASAASGNSKLRLGAKIASAAVGGSVGSASLEGERIAAEKLVQSSGMLQGMAKGGNKELNSLQLSSSGTASQAIGSLSQTSNTADNLSSEATTGQSRIGISSSGGSASSSGSSALGGGQFPDSTRSAVSVSPPFEGEDLFQFSPMPLVFSVNFDAQHLNPNYKAITVTGVLGSENGNGRSLSAFNPDNIQQSVPAKGPSVSPSDPIAAELRAILHPALQGQN